VPCSRYFTKATDGLAQNWDGDLVFVNPPYGHRGNGELQRWITKAVEEFKAGHARKIVLLLPARYDTSGMRKLFEAGAATLLLMHRLKFGGLDVASPFASVVVVLGATDAEVVQLAKMLPDNRRLLMCPSHTPVEGAKP
jgi:hypothetical protein